MKFNPIYYHLQHREMTEDLPFWKRMAKEMGNPILELGCGTGRVLHPLIEAGYDVSGIDISYQALHFLRKQSSEQQATELKLFQADFERYHLAKKFSLVIMACNTLSTFPRINLIKVFTGVNRHLLENGVFAASMPNPSYLASLPEEGDSEVEGSFLHPESANPIQVSSGWQRVDQSIAITWHYDHLLPDGQVARETVEIMHYLTQKDEYLAELQAADLIPVEILGDFDRSEYHGDSPYLILVAGKRTRF
ncbi:MAG: class I SAM-dependent methyltransferase [Chloroflexota bacterium]|nr:MAG: class I SAM-dependent methyltransferase [Chloroflexota bacterium]